MTQQQNVKPILEFMNSPQGRSVRTALGSALLLKGGNILVKGLGVILVASGPLDFCPTNVALGYPLSGEETRRELAKG